VPYDILQTSMTTLNNVKWKYLGLAIAYIFLVWLSQLLVATPDPLAIVALLGSIGLVTGVLIAVKHRSWVKHYSTILTWLAILLGSITAGQLSSTTIVLAQFIQYSWAVAIGLGLFVVLIAMIFYLVDIFRSGAFLAGAET